MFNILDYNLPELKAWMKENGEQEFRAKQVFDWIYKDVWSFDEMNNIPQKLRNKLIDNFKIEVPEIIERLVSKDKDTYKFLLKFIDNNIIETVVMKYSHGNSICVSTQIGCRMGCKFCASTVGGIVRNLTAGEILGQVLIARREIGERISNVVLMGSGEPLDNYDNVIKFIELINSDYGLNIGQRHITLSTCGIIPKIYELADRKMQITLAISLHASEDEKRRSIMPIANKYSISDIIASCKYYIEKTNKRITFEYALVKGVNDSKQNARELANLLKGLLCHVNLIPINVVKESTFEKPEEADINEFGKILNIFGIENTVRREMGSDISAACGQLRRQYIGNDRKKEVT